MNDIGFSFPAGVKVLLKAPPLSIDNLLRKQWYRFTSPAVMGEPTILAQPADSLFDTGLHRPLGTDVQPYTFQVTTQGAEALFYYRGKADLRVRWRTMGIRVDYCSRHGMADRLYGVLLWLLRRALNNAGAALLHGAAIVPKGENGAVLLVGPRGSGKTLLLLTLLRNAKGCYLAEDKMILFKGRVSSFHDDVPIQDHHIDALPWLVKRSSSLMALARYRSRRIRWRRFLEQHLPSYLLPRFEKWVIGSAAVPVDALTGRQKNVDEASLDRILILTHGDTVAVRECSRANGLAALMCIQEQVLGAFSRLEQHLFLWSQENASSPATALGEIGGTVPFFLVDLPSEWNLERVSRELPLS